MSGNTGKGTDVGAMAIALIGYGEVGGIFGQALAARGVASVTAWDIALPDPAKSTAMRGRAQRDGVRLAPNAASAVAGADLVISAVTASATRDAAASAAPALRAGAFVLDVNSASPQTKAACGTLVNAAGGRYVESAVMTSVPPSGIRSVMIKGMEAIVIESFLAARRYGVEGEVLASLAETFPGIDWEQQGSYFWTRVVQHGKRRAEEMRESAATVREAGFDGIMAGAIAQRHQWVADLAAAGTFDGVPIDAGWREFADRIPRDAD